MKRKPHMRICPALLALALLVSLPPRALAAERLEDFVDLDAGAWYAQGVRYCLQNDLMRGRGERQLKYFDPDEMMTRAQLATILWRMEGEPTTGLTMQFTDVPERGWYSDAVRWAQSVDVMTGYDVLTFAPNDPITREQLAAILWRYAYYRNGFVPAISDPGYETYKDYDKVSDYADEAMRWANGLGIITGARTENRENVLVPWKQSSRAATATILMRFCLDMGIFD